jgi:hypothetical protein
MKRHAVLALAAFLACCRAFALNPALNVGQHEHMAWSVRDGFFKGSHHGIPQTPDRADIVAQTNGGAVFLMVL